MSRVTDIESRFADHNIPLALALGLTSVTSRIRRLVDDRQSHSVHGPPSEFDLAVLGLLAIEQRLEKLGGSLHPSEVEVSPAVEETSWLR